MTSHLQSDFEMHEERLTRLALDLNRLDQFCTETMAMVMGALSALNPDDLVNVLAASKDMAMLMLKIVLQVESGAGPK